MPALSAESTTVTFADADVLTMLTARVRRGNPQFRSQGLDTPTHGTCFLAHGHSQKGERLVHSTSARLGRGPLRLSNIHKTQPSV